MELKRTITLLQEVKLESKYNFNYRYKTVFMLSDIKVKNNKAINTNSGPSRKKNRKLFAWHSLTKTAVAVEQGKGRVVP